MVGSAMRLVLASAMLLLATAAAGNPDDDAPAPGQPSAVTAESRSNDGQALARRNDWAGAELACRDATRLRPIFPEPWNGLGYSPRKQRKFDELRLRPQYPQALEYL